MRGLMLDGKRKSIEPMAARLADGDEQCLQQFVNQSPWDPVAVRRALARRMSRELAAEAWVIDDTGFPKFGKHSVGVARQYSGALGRSGTVRSGCRSTLRLTRRRVRLIGGCSSPRSGTRTASSTRTAARSASCPRRPPCREVASGAGDDRRADRLGDRAAGRARRRRVRRYHRVSLGAPGARDRLRAGCQGHNLCLPGGRRAQPAGPARRSRAPAQAALPRGSVLAQAARARGRRSGRHACHLAGRHTREDDLSVPRSPGSPGEHRTAEHRQQNR